MVLTFSNRLSIDDYIQIGEHKGKIVDITMQSIHLLNDDDDLVYIPNNKAFDDIVVNLTKGDIRKASIDFEMSYDHFASVADMEEKLIAALDDLKDKIRPGSYNLRTVKIEHQVAVFKFQVTLLHYDKALERQIRRRVLRFIIDIVQNHPEKP